MTSVGIFFKFSFVFYVDEFEEYLSSFAKNYIAFFQASIPPLLMSFDVLVLPVPSLWPPAAVNKDNLLYFLI